MKKNLVILATLMALSGSVAAQERSAGQAYDAQVNWGALKTGIDQVSTQNKALAASMAVLQTSVDSLNTKMAAIAACGAQGKIWNGKGCVAPAPTPQPAETRWVAHGGSGCSTMWDMAVYRKKLPACSGPLGAKCSVKGQVCLSGVDDVCNMTTTTTGSPNSSGRDVTRISRSIGYSICQ